MTQTVRNEHIDIMKGFAILLVLLGHRFMTNTAEGAQHPVAIIIYSFHMAFFFFISGYVNEYTRQLARKGVKRFISDKIQTLILPFLVWTLICYLSNDGNYTLKGLADSFNFYPAKGYWFLPVLFSFFIIYLSIKKIGLKLGGVIYIAALIITGLLVRQVFPIWYASYLLAFLFGGYMADISVEKQLTRTPIYGISALTLITCWCLYPMESSAIGKVTNLAMMFIMALTSCITFFNFFKAVELPNFLKRYLIEIGKYTLVLYLVPVLILPAHSFRIDGQMTFTMVNLIILAVAVTHSLVSYVIGRVIFEIPYLRFILFGKK